MQENDLITLKAIRPEQHFTEPPPRYSEASLVKTLEAHGIGRPSTYASIIYTLLSREYVTLENKTFSNPPMLGKSLMIFFPHILNNMWTTTSPQN